MKRIFISAALLFAVYMQAQDNQKAPDNWYNLDQQNDKVNGMGTERVYTELLKNAKSTTVIVGVIDSGYRGELQATFRKHRGVASETYKVGDRIAQIIIIPYPPIEFIEADELSDSERGTGGFGSTGK